MELKKVFDLLEELFEEVEDDKALTKLEDIHLILSGMFPISAE